MRMWVQVRKHSGGGSKKSSDDGFQIVVGNAVWPSLHWPQIQMAVNIQPASVQYHRSQDQRHFRTFDDVSKYLAKLRILPTQGDATERAVGRSINAMAMLQSAPFKLLHRARALIFLYGALALLQRTTPSIPLLLRYGHCSEIAFRQHCYRACYIALLLTRDRLM